MTQLELIENREKNIKQEIISGLIALTISLVFVFSNHISQSYQIYCVIVLFLIHQLNQAIIFNRWNINAEYQKSKIRLRIIIIILVLLLTFLNFATINDDFTYYVHLARGKKANTFYSVAIYCGVYLVAYWLGLRRLIKK